MGQRKEIRELNSSTNSHRHYTYVMEEDGEPVECTMTVPLTEHGLGAPQRFYKSALAGAKKYQASKARRGDDGPYRYAPGEKAHRKPVGYGVLDAHEKPEEIARLVCLFVEEGFSFGYLKPTLVEDVIAHAVVLGDFIEAKSARPPKNISRVGPMLEPKTSADEWPKKSGD
jgi:hypothetical protein